MLNAESFVIVPNDFLEAPRTIDCDFIRSHALHTGIYWEEKRRRAKEIFTNIRNGALKFRLKRFLKRFR